MEQFNVGHRAIDTALSHYAVALPQAAYEAGDAITTWLEGINQSVCPSVCWEASTLTTDGFPVEFTVSSAAEYISYTTEVAGPETPECTRLTLAANQLARLGKHPLPAALHEQWTSMQHTGQLRYGVWASGRHGVGKSRYKLYVEVPPVAYAVARAWVPSDLSEWPCISEQPALLRMIGFEAATGRTELYFRINAGERWEIARMLREMGFGVQADTLLQFVEMISGRSIDEHALGRSVGCSVALDANGKPEAAAVFGFAWAVFRGGDATIRNVALRMADQQGWPFDIYRTLSEPVSQYNTKRTRHGMASFSVTTTGQTAFQLGLRPPG